MSEPSSIEEELGPYDPYLHAQIMEQKLAIAVVALEGITQMNHRDQGAVHGNVVPTTILLVTALSIASEALAKIRGKR